MRVLAAILFIFIAISTANATPFTITPTFDSSITGQSNAAEIESEINAAVSIYQSMFTDPMNVSILFRYASTAPDGSSLSGNTLAQSNYAVYAEGYSTYKTALIADGKTANDASAIANLPVASAFPNNPANVDVSSADGRAVGLNTPAVMNATGGIGGSGPVYDGIVTLNSTQSIVFNRNNMTASSNDGERLMEHEIDEILGLGSILPSTKDFTGKTAIMPEDLFRYSAPGTLSLSTGAASSYFSINGGVTSTAGFNQNGSGDYGDWLSPGCPQSPPLVQYAFSCPGSPADISSSSPEGIALDAVGYDLVTNTPEPGSFALLGAGIFALFVRRARHNRVL